MPLNALPPEIFETVAQHLDPADLVATRLVSRDIAAKTLRTFATVHFTEKCFLLSSRNCLLAAIDIAKHPVFGPALRKLSFYIDTAKRPLTLGIPGGFGDGGLWEAYESRLAIYDFYSGFISDTALDFSGKPDGLGSCVGTLLSALARLNRVEEVVVTNSEASSILPAAAPTFKDMIRLHTLEVDETFGSVATCLLDQAIGFLRWPALEAFTMAGTDWALRPSTVVDSPIRETAPCGFLACETTLRLRRITLALQIARFHSLDQEILFIFITLQHNFELEYLDLSFADIRYGPFRRLTWLATDALFGYQHPAIFVALKEFRLAGVSVTLSAQRNFVKDQPVLQELVLADSVIRLQGVRFEDLREEGEGCYGETLSRILGVHTRIGAVSLV
ncbi:hypothetical protein CLAFUR0_14694 [Fulvia fulva]|nr:hypothetical protein CLAFUR0_14694 [Fulvia fulva]